MNELDKKEKARSGAATPEQAKETQCGLAMNVPDLDINISNQRKQRSFIEAFLPIGKENCLTAQQLADIVGVSDIRVITRDIARLRQMRVPVCAACSSEHSGYYIAASPDELAAYLYSFNKRRREINKSYFGLESYLDEWIGQVRIEGFEDEQTGRYDLL